MTCCPVVELRRYRLRPGKREALVSLFDREFVETQEATGIDVIGQFTDLDEPDHFVWLRGFPDLARRAAALEAFYTGPAWARHRDEANATMVNSDNVLLLRPAQPGSGFGGLDIRRPPGEAAAGRGIVVSTICSLAPETDVDFSAFFERAVRPVLTSTSASVLATFVTEPGPNGFRRLPVRAGETVFVWFSGFADQNAYRAHLDALTRSRGWTDEVFPEIDRRIWRRVETSRLVPTARSRLQVD